MRKLPIPSTSPTFRRRRQGAGTWRQLDDGRVEAGGLLLEPDEFELIARARGGHELAEEADLLIALDTSLTPELEAEGLAREVAHRLQGLRKTAGYELADRIAATVGGDPALVEQLQPHRDWLDGELLADELVVNPEATLHDPARTEEIEAGTGSLG